MLPNAPCGKYGLLSPNFMFIFAKMIDKKVNVIAVNYLNAKPLIKGIVQHKVLDDITLTTANPANAAQLLIDGVADVGLVPVATIPLIPEANIISDYGIAGGEHVASVCIFSHVPIEKITHIYLDYQSRTSVKLAQLLMIRHFKKEVEYLPATENYINHIKGTVAGVIIGDRALEQLRNFPYVYDLAYEWKQMTGNPFVFAAWIANKPLPTSFIENFNEANKLGLSYIQNVIAENPYPAYDLEKYYTENIVFRLDDACRQGLQHFLGYLRQYKGVLI